MSLDLNLDVIKLTQKSLGPFIKKPPLTEKLLKKPPFRFLHDIITAVIKNTGFLDGLFTPEELNSENVKDREKKVAFLQKVIQVISLVTDTQLSVKPSKIISGQEPEKTNELLQKIGDALSQNLSSDVAVKKVTDGKNISKPKVEDKAAKNIVKTKNDKTTINSKVTEKNDKNLKSKPISNAEANQKSKQKSNDTLTKKKPPETEIKVPKKKTIKETGENTKNIERKEIIPILLIEDNIKNTELESLQPNESIEENKSTNETILDSTEQLHHDVFNEVITLNHVEKQETDSIENILSNEPEHVNENVTENVEILNTITDPPTLSENIKLSNEREEIKTLKSAKRKNNQVKNIDNDLIKEDKIEDQCLERNIVDKTEPKTSLRPPSVRPTSSRPGAPRFKEMNVDMILNDPVYKGKVNIIVESYDKQNEEEDESIIVETSLENGISNMELENNQVKISGINHGHLVQQILETRKELDGEESKVEIEWEWGARREREASFKEVETLRNGLQTLSRAANPLGKLMDYVQEDVEIMKQELRNWREIRKKAAITINQQEEQLEKSMQPLEAKLKQLDDSIADQLELILTVKSNILRNDLKIKKIISGE